MSNNGEIILTKQEQLEEYFRCALDFEYCCEKYFKIEDKRRGGNYPFELLWHQKEVFNAFETQNNVIVNKYRQGGITTLTCSYIAWKVMFFKDTKVVLIANNLTLAKSELFKKVTTFISQLPSYLISETIKNTETLKIYDNGSEICARAANNSSTRGLSPSMMIIDECAHITDSEFFTAARPSISMGGRIIMISSPKGRGNLFYELFDDALNKKNDFHAVELKWYNDDRLNKDLVWINGDEKIVEFDKEKQKELLAKGYLPSSSWYVKECNGLGNNRKRIAQEIEGSFLGSSLSFISDELIFAQETKNICEPKLYEGFDKNFWIWEEPDPNKKYILGADVSSGRAEDYSTISILCIEDMKQVAEYQGKIAPDIFGELINVWGRRYNYAHTVIDTTGGYGTTTITKLIDLDYKNLYYSDKVTTEAKEKLTEYRKYNDTYPGLCIGRNRTDMLLTLERCFREEVIIVRSSRLMSELKKFSVSAEGKINHSRSSHDDLIWALTLALYVSQTAFGKINRGIETTKTMIDSWVVIDSNNITPNKYVENSIEHRLNNTPKPNTPPKKNLDDFNFFVM